MENFDVIDWYFGLPASTQMIIALPILWWLMKFIAAQEGEMPFEEEEEEEEEDDCWGCGQCINDCHCDDEVEEKEEEGEGKATLIQNITYNITDSSIVTEEFGTIINEKGD